MPLDKLPGAITLPSRDDLIADYKRDYRFHGPAGVSTDDGTLPDVEARVLADQLIPLYNAAKVSGDNLVLEEAAADALNTWAKQKGIPTRLPAIGARGFLVAGLGFASGGSKIFADDEVTVPGVRYVVTTTNTYKAGQLIPIVGADVGLGTNQPAGTVLLWTSPRPGCEPQSAVWEQSDGSGLSGGRDIESDEDLLARILIAGQEPAASGNDAMYQRTVEATPGVPIEKCFTYPAILGPGTIAIAFTVRRESVTASRIPTSSEIAAVEVWTLGQGPADDGVFLCSLVAHPVNVAVRVDWRPGADGWADATPWPAWVSIGGESKVTAVTDALHFTVSGSSAPPVGNTIAFYDPSTATFFRKKVLTVTGAGPYAIVCDTAAAASDETYVPPVGAIACPWSDSLQSLVAPVADYFAALGPGEQVAWFFDLGTRQKRSPLSPGLWPSTVGNRLVTDVQDAPSVLDAALVDPDPTTIPVHAPVGTPGVLSYLQTCGQISVFPLST